jgi:PAS domain S-box-containing protein
MAASANHPHQRVLVLAPTRKDAALTCAVLDESSIRCFTCDTLADVCREIEIGAGAAILTEESLTPDVVQPLAIVLRNEPAWSELPLLVLTAGGADSPIALHALKMLGNVTLLERPVRFTALVSTVQAALRARERQVQIRDHLAERRRAAETLERRLQHLQTIYSLTRAVSRAEPIDVIYTEALHGLQAALGADRAAILLFDAEGVMRFKAWRGLSDKYRRAVEGHSPWKPDESNPRPVTIPDAAADPSLGALRSTIVNEGIGALGFVPLLYESRLLGKFMLYYNAPHEFLDEELQLAQNIADHTAFAIERRRNDHALRESEERYRRLIETASEGVWEIDARGTTVFVNKQLCEILGVQADQLHDVNAFEFVHPDDRTHARQHWERRTTGAADVSEWRLRRGDGSYVWVSASASPVLNSNGQIVGAFAMMTDINERKSAERRLAAEHTITRMLADTHTLQEVAPHILQVLCETFEAQTGYFWVVDEHTQAWRRTAATAAAPSPDGYQPFDRELWASGGTVLLRELLKQKHAPQIREALTAGFECATIFPIIGGGEQLGALEFYYTAECQPNQWRDRMMAAVSQDIAQFIRRRRAEIEVIRHREHLEQLVAERTAELEQSHQRLRLSERMAALGTLSAGLGHDMGNLLLPIRSRLDAMLHTLTKEREKDQRNKLNNSLLEHLNAIRQCTDYLQSLTNGLRLLALDPQDSDAGGQETDLNRWWPNVEALMKNALPRHVELKIIGFGPEYQNGQSLPPLAIAPHRMTQTIFNLVKNAGDALRPLKQGRVEIHANVDADQSNTPQAPDGKPNLARTYARLSVADNGPGMSSDIKARATEPFFTTKTRSLSTGLGLSLVHGIVSSVGGSMEIDSAPDHGTRIILNVPLAKQSKSQHARRRHERQLAALSLADPRHRTLVHQVLGSLGFDVLTLEEPCPPANTHVWIIQPTADLLDAANEFLDGGDDRLVLVAGHADQQRARPGMIFIGDSFRLSHLRDSIRQFSSSKQEQSYDQRTDSSLVRR